MKHHAGLPNWDAIMRQEPECLPVFLTAREAKTLLRALFDYSLTDYSVGDVGATKELAEKLQRRVDQ